MNPIKNVKRNLKRKVANTTGIPTTESGRKRKMNALQGQDIFWLIVICAVAYFFSAGSNAAEIITN